MKTYGVILLAVVFLVVVIQNSEAVDLEFFGWSLSMSGALLFPLILVIGFCLGFFVAKWPKKHS